MEKDTEMSFLEVGLYLSYMNYHATGEGVRSCISLAGSVQSAEKLIKEKLHDYFHVGIVTARIEATASDDIAQMIEWVPPQVKSALAAMPRGAAEYYSEFYYNLS